MRHPLAWLTLAFSLGILVFAQAKISFWLLYFFSGALFILSLLSSRKFLRFDIFLLCLIFLSGGILLKNRQALSRSHISCHISDKNAQPYIIKGFIASQPLPKNKRASFIFNICRIQRGNLEYNCCGKILVYASGRQNLRYGEELVLSGVLLPALGADNPRRKGPADYLRRQGIYSVMRLSPAGIIVTYKNRGQPVKRLAYWLKERAEGVFFRRACGVSAGILDAMLLGEKRNVPALIYNSMIKTGTVHILVVSGFNVGMVIFIVVLILKMLRLPRRTRIFLAAPLLIIYCLLAGASTPVVRATIMGIFFLSAYLVKREPDIFNSLSLAALFILGINPQQLFDAGFQLSFASVISIAWLYPKIRQLLGVEKVRAAPLRLLIEGCLISFSAWLGTAGFIAYYFKIFSPVTVLANIFIVPLAALITLCGFSLLAAELVLPFFVPLFCASSEFLVMLLILLNSLLLKLPFACFSWGRYP